MQTPNGNGGAGRYRVQLTCDAQQRITVVSFELEAATPMDAVKRAEARLEEEGPFQCGQIVAVHVESLVERPDVA